MTAYSKRILVSTTFDKLSEVVSMSNKIIQASILSRTGDEKINRIAFRFRKDSPCKISISALIGLFIFDLVVLFFAWPEAYFKYGYNLSRETNWFLICFLSFLLPGIYLYLHYYGKKEGIVFNIEARPFENKGVFVIDISASDQCIEGKCKELLKSDVIRLLEFMNNNSLNIAELPEETFADRWQRLKREWRTEYEVKEKEK